MRKSILFTLAVMVLGVQTAEAKPVEYLGYKRCQGCHKKEAKSWKESTMSKAFDALVPGVNPEGKTEAGLDPTKDYTSDPKCLRCHATGYGEPGGFKNFIDTPDLAGVTCEACHNAGGRYVSVMAKKRKTYRLIELLTAGYVRPSQAACNKCHVPGCPTTDDDYDMDFDDSIGHDRFPLKYDH